MINSEQEKEFRFAEQEDRKFCEAMQELVRFQPFQLYREHLDRRINSLAQLLFLPLDESVNAAERQEFVKGTLNGYILARDLPSVNVMVMTSGPQSTSEDESDAEE